MSSSQDICIQIGISLIDDLKILTEFIRKKHRLKKLTKKLKQAFFEMLTPEF